MKAQFVYERLNFEKGQDPKHSIGIGKIALIKKWFDEWAPDNAYKIDKDLNIEVEGYLDLENTNITSLPDNLRVERGLYLRKTKITSLPDNLRVGGFLDLENTKITSLPDNLKVGRSLYLTNTKITSLPDNLRVEGKIYKDF